MSIFKECPVCGAHLDPGETCNCREPKLVTYADWEAAGSFEKAASPGDAVEERIVDEFLNCLPPVRQERGFIQCGEPYSHEYFREAAPYSTVTAGVGMSAALIAALSQAGPAKTPA